MSRTENAIKNTKYALISKLLSLFISFVSRTVFIHVLGNTFLGINGLFTEVLSVLSFAELGFGTALNYSLYAPVVRGDTVKTVKLLHFYKTVYRVIALIVAGLGLLLVPFLKYIVKGADTLTLHDLRLFFLLFLTNTVVSYFVSYKYSYVNARQENYLMTEINFAVNSLISCAQIVVILIFRNYLVYLLTHTFLILLSRFFIALYLNKKYPILKEQPKVPLSEEEKQPIYQEIKGLIVHQFSSVAVHQTDNIIISSLTGLGVVMVGFVSNYNLLINSVLGFVTQVFNSVTSGFGNLAASSTKENYRKVFFTANFINFWIYGFCCIAFFVLIPPFITLWIGRDRLIDTMSLFLIIMNCYLQGQSLIYNNARLAVGNFNRDKWWALTQAIVNLVVSIWGAKQLGLVGVYIGTVVSRLVNILFRPYATYRFMFDHSCGEYYLQLFKYFGSAICAGTVCYFATFKLLENVTLWTFILSAIIVLILPNLIFAALYYRSNEFKDLRIRLNTIIKEHKHA